MLLFTHTACGVLIAGITNDPLIGSLTALLSHYLLDVIPHEPKEELFYVSPDKSLRSKEIEDKLKRRHFTSLIDLLISIGIVSGFLLYMFPSPKCFNLLVIVGFSVLPDILTIAAIYFPNKLLTLHHKYHFQIHKIIPFFVNHYTTYTMQILLSAVMVYFAKRII
jgi:hypothetical protein